MLNVFPLASPTGSVVDHSIRLHASYSLSHWDSLLLGGCIDAGVDTLYSEDLSDGAVYDTVRVINPFTP